MAQIEPVFSFIIPTYKTPLPFLIAALDSVMNQTSDNWEICIADDGSRDIALTTLLRDYAGRDSRIKLSLSDRNAGISSASNRAAALATGTYLALLDHDDIIAPQTVMLLTDALRLTPNADVLYSDEDKLDELRNVVGDYVKPDFSIDFLRSTMYVGHLFVVRRSVFEEVGGFRSEFDGSQDFDLALRACTSDRIIVHVPHVLYRWRASPASTALDLEAKPWAVQSARRVIDDFAKRLSWPAFVEDGHLPATFRLRYQIKPATKARIIVLCSDATKPTLDGGQVPLLVNACAYLESKTAGIDFKISAVSKVNLGSNLSGWCAAKNIPLYQPLGNSHPGLVELINVAIRDDDADIIVVMRDTIELLDDQWLIGLTELAQLPEVAAVGPRVSYLDRSLRHAGLVYVDQQVRHCFSGTPEDEMEYQGFAHMIRNYSAVSADCMAVRRDAWASVGGFDEAFHDDLFDVDFCLRAIKQGMRVVFTPFSYVQYIGAKTGDESSEDDRALLANRHGGYRDPFFCPPLLREEPNQKE